MKKISYFLMVGLAFTALQVSTVAAEDPRGGDRVDTRDPRGGDRVETRDPRGAPPRDPRAAPPRDTRVREEVDTRDPRSGDGVPRDTRVREEVETRDTPVEDNVETRGLSKREMIQECKKTYGKKRKNKAAKQACIAAAKGQ